MKRYQIKVCGNKHINNLLKLKDLEIDYVGYIFYDKSPRFADNNMVFSLSPNASKVGVFVDEENSKIVKKVNNYKLDVVQLHGNESLENIQNLKQEIPTTQLWKAFGIDENFDFDVLKQYKKSVDAFIFDTKSTDFGGSGQKFDWTLLDKYVLEVPFFLSGGIKLEDVQELKKIQHPQLIGFDINSGFEIEPGIKDAKKIKEFTEQINP